jgi:predicted anti-sigma-YlaC factor YlaD
MTETTARRILTRSLVVLLLTAALPGCSVKRMAINMVGNALAESGSTFSSDDDPELVAAAVPFGLKTMESLLASSPRHKGLLTAACSSFTQYAYAFVQTEADYVEAQDLQRATAMRVRAKKLYLRARDYGLRALDVDIPGFAGLLRKDPDAVLARTTVKQVPVLYYTGASWAAAFAVDITDSQLSVEQSLFEAIMRRALVLDESWERGSIHDFFISWEAGHAGTGGSIAKAREHFERAKKLAAGQRLSPLVSFAESVSVAQQNKKEFEQLLNEVVAADPEALAPEQRLANILAQRRARWLLSREDELF